VLSVTHRAFILVVVALTTLAAFGSPSLAQVQVKSSDLKCRNHIGATVQRLVRKGLSLVDGCYSGASSRLPCDQVQTLRPAVLAGAPGAFSRATNLAAGITNAWCAQEPSILVNYPTAQNGGATINLVGPQVQQLLDSSAATLQGPTVPGGKGKVARAKRRCIRAIGRVRSTIVNQILAQAIRCQRAIDRTATSFGLISPICLVPAQHAARLSRSIVAACAGFTGPDVGSCDPLPTCVITSATQTGHQLAVTTYGVKPEQQGELCGNGIVDTGETCDDGAANSPTGACTDQCEKAACGDGRVETGVEECDPGSQPGTTTPIANDPNCTYQCTLTRCGDGVVQKGGNRPDEQCDDGNTVAGDGCSPTCEFETVSCQAGGTIDVTLAFVGSASIYSGDVGGFDFSIAYPTSVTFPGSGFLSVDDPSDPATRIVLLDSADNLYQNYAIIFFDYDTSIRTDLVTNGGVFKFPGNDSLPFERIRFDCAPGTPLRESDFACAVNMLATPIGGVVNPILFPPCKVTLPR